MAQAAAEDVDRAVKAARKAFEEGPWPRMPGCVRLHLQFLLKHSGYLAITIS